MKHTAGEMQSFTFIHKEKDQMPALIKKQHGLGLWNWSWAGEKKSLSKDGKMLQKYQ